MRRIRVYMTPLGAIGARIPNGRVRNPNPRTEVSSRTVAIKHLTFWYSPMVWVTKPTLAPRNG